MLQPKRWIAEYLWNLHLGKLDHWESPIVFLNELVSLFIDQSAEGIKMEELDSHVAIKNMLNFLSFLKFLNLFKIYFY